MKLFLARLIFFFFFLNYCLFSEFPEKPLPPLCSTVLGWYCCNHAAVSRAGAPGDNNPVFLCAQRLHKNPLIPVWCLCAVAAGSAAGFVRLPEFLGIPVQADVTAVG